jgi:hypothetical protein
MRWRAAIVFASADSALTEQDPFGQKSGAVRSLAGFEGPFHRKAAGLLRLQGAVLQAADLISNSPFDELMRAHQDGSWVAVNHDHLPACERQQLECLEGKPEGTLADECCADPDDHSSLCYGSVLQSAGCKHLVLSDVNQEYAHANTDRHPPLDALSIASMLENRVLMIYGESTAEQLLHSFLKAVNQAMPQNDRSELRFTHPTSNWTSSSKLYKEANQINRDYWLERFNFTLRLVKTYKHEETDVLIGNLERLSAEGKKADVVITLLGNHYNHDGFNNDKEMREHTAKLKEDLASWVTAEGKMAIVLEVISPSASLISPHH